MKVELNGIHKTFGAVRANAGISITIPAGTIQGILGENGAGKSTLMKVLSGYLQADQGEIRLDNIQINIKSPTQAIQHGIGMLHQDPLDFPPMRIVDNFLVGQAGSLFPNRKRASTAIIDLSQKFGFSIDPFAYIDSLTVGERQQVEILRLLWLGARILIFDEPTTGISALQKDKLFTTLRQLAEQGKTVIFVSHKLEDVEGLCHKIAVLRQGQLVGEIQPPYHTPKLVEMMFGKEISIGESMSCRTGEVSLALHDLSVEDYRLKLEKININLKNGEVVGLAGMEGSGQGLFMRACAGLVRPTGGKVILRNRNITGATYHAFQNNGVAFLPASRLEEGLVSGMSLTEHFILAEEPEGFFINWSEGQKLSQQRINDFYIHGTPASPVEELSGGNQQRALLALLRDPLFLLLLEHPIRGLDIESSIYIWGKLKERCSKGTSILFISSDLEEILQYSDRVMVFFSGKVTKPLDAKKLTIETLGQLIGGKGWEELDNVRGSTHV